MASQQAKTLAHVDDPVKMAADNGFSVGCHRKLTEKQLKGLRKFHGKIWLLKEIHGTDAMFVSQCALELPLKSLEKVYLYQNAWSSQKLSSVFNTEAKLELKKAQVLKALLSLTAQASQPKPCKLACLQACASFTANVYALEKFSKGEVVHFPVVDKTIKIM